jgi:hypothetical protein
MAGNVAALKASVALALAGDWDGAHRIAQDYSDPIANWIHAVLHKIEGDVWNSKYWYARTNGKQYDDYSDSKDELLDIQRLLQP